MTIPRSLRATFLASFAIAFFAYASLAQAQTNLIQNGDFETAGPSGWTKIFWGTPTPTFTYPATGHSGSSASVTFSANSNGDARWQPTAVNVTAGQTYTYTEWYKSTVASEIDVEFTNASGAKSYGWVADVPSSNNAWQQISASIVVPSGITKMSVYHLLDKAGTLAIDDVSLVGGSTPPPGAPTVTISSNPTSIQSGQSSTITWSSTNATSCTATGSWTGTKATSGTQSVSPTATATYTLACTGAGGTTSQSTTVTVSATPPGAPTATISANPTSITSGQSSTLTWSSTNATSCTASGAWSGTKATSGTQSVSPTTNSTYTIVCSGASGTTTPQSATITVNSTPPPPGGFSEGMVSLAFDDAWLSQYQNALPILQAANLKGTFYLTTQPIREQWDGFMTPNQVKDIAQKGHEIAGHTVSHADLTTLSQSRINTEIKSSKTYLQNLTGTTVTSLAYPYGAVNNTVKNLVRNAGYTNARGVQYDTLNTATSDKYDLKSMCIETSNPVSQVKAEIDKAKANKQWFILCFHEILNGGDQWSMTPAKFQEIIDYVKSSGVKVVTMKEGRALMSN
jgi:peptidoglycan/xylan/chitin deacetylase (PgdA/CDA1 family)